MTSTGTSWAIRALRLVGEFLQDNVRDTDCVGRYGGDEFVVILPDTPREGAALLASRIAEKGQSLSVDAGGVSLPIQLSVGAATLTPLENGPQYELLRSEVIGKVAADLIRRADDCLYENKGTGEVADVRVLGWQDAVLSPAA